MSSLKDEEAVLPDVPVVPPPEPVSAQRPAPRMAGSRWNPFNGLSPWGRRYLAVGMVFVLVVGAFNGGMLTERYQNNRASGVPSKVPPELQKEFENFLQVWQLVGREYYYGTPDTKFMDYGASRGLLSTLGDDYTVFLEPVQQQGVREQMSGDYIGIGVYLENADGRWYISAPITDAPADRAGLKPRDEIVRVDGREVAGQSQDDLQKQLRGEKETTVRLTIRREGLADPFDIDLVREVINIPSVQLRFVENNLALITVTIFGDKTTAQLDKALKEVQAAGSKGIILDLRNNGGGWVAAAQEMLGRFVDPARGPALLEDTQNGAQARAMLYTPTPGPSFGPNTPTAVIPTKTPVVLSVPNAKRDPIVPPQDGGVTFYTLPLVVLINGGTASASEIVVGALQDYKRATLIGTTTYGKGSLQAVHEFRDGSSARITIAQWLTPLGRVIQKQGLLPDIEQAEGDGDAQLQRAIAFLRDGR
jgi:carboxyl-terminal processing protease